MSPAQAVGPQDTLQLFGIRLVGLSAASAKKLLFTLALIVALAIVGALVRLVVHRMPRVSPVRRFWANQTVALVTLAIGLIGFLSIWFNEPGKMTTFLGLVSAGLAFALQKVVTAFAGYLVILRGHTFSVGDRITMGGVRGDVVGLGFLQTRIMEMGQPPSIEDQADPAMWVKSRQYTGRLVIVSNDKIFEEPVYNYTLEFPYIWEEMQVPVPYSADRRLAEQLLLQAVKQHTSSLEQISSEQLAELQRRYFLNDADTEPEVYYRLTSNWLELTVRFIAPTYGVRELKSCITRDLLDLYDRAGIIIASTTFDIVGFPKTQLVERADDDQAGDDEHAPSP